MEHTINIEELVQDDHNQRYKGWAEAHGTLFQGAGCG